MAVFPKGRDAIAAAVARQKSGGSFTRSIYFKDKEGENEKVIQFITPIDEVCEVQHYSVRVGTTNSNGAMMRDFIDPRPLLGDDAYNPIATREWTAGPVNPATKHAAVAVELVEDKKGNLTVATHEYENSKGEDVEAPNVGVLIQSPSVFWSWFKSYADRKNIDLTGQAFAVERVVNSSPMKYNIMPLGEGVELDDEITGAIDLEEYLESLMDEERFKELIDTLDDDHVLSHYAQQRGKKGKAKSKAAPARSTKSRAARAAEDNEPEDDDTDPDQDERAELYENLKASLKKSAKS